MSALSTPWIVGLPQPLGVKPRLKSPWYNPIWLLSQAHDATSQDRGQALPVDRVDLADIKETLQGSSDAYGRLVNRYQQTIASQVWGYAPHQDMIEDLVHDVFVEAYLSLPTYRGQAPFLHWLRKIAVRVGYRHWKQEVKRRAETRLQTDATTVPSRAASDGEAMDAAARLYRVLDRLSPRDRAVITLIHLEERTVAEAADLLGWSQAMVKVQAFRARRKLKKLLQEAP
jgi:RNA polymerase sigma-70 factor, ECF subfamily